VHDDPALEAAATHLRRVAGTRRQGDPVHLWDPARAAGPGDSEQRKRTKLLLEAIQNTWMLLKSISTDRHFSTTNPKRLPRKTIFLPGILHLLADLAVTCCSLARP
jgi:hypothetical protein